MARTVNAQQHGVKRNEILDAAQRLVYRKGYEQMTIRDLLDDLGISKGAFYHYFASKQALLEALIDRMRQEGEQILVTIVRDPQLSPIEKLQRFFAGAGRWKAARKAYISALLRVWYADENALIRQRVQATTVEHVSPWLTQIVHQGHREGVLTTAFPDLAGVIVLNLLQGLGDALAHIFLNPGPGHDDLARAEHLTAAYNNALEHVLGAPPGSLQIMDAQTLREWFAETAAQTAGPLTREA